MSDYRYSVGSFARVTTPNTLQTISGIVDANGAFAIKGIIFWGTAQNTSGFDSIGRTFQGMTDGVNNRCTSTYRYDNFNSGGQRPRAYMTNLWCIALNTDQPTFISDGAEIISIGTGSFSIKWHANDGTPWNIHYIVLGGTNLKCQVGSFNNPTSTGNQDVTTNGLGTIKALLFMNVISTVDKSTSVAGVQYSNTPGIGFTDGTNQGYIATHGGNFPSSTQTIRYQRTDACILATGNASSSSETARASIISLGSDTFRLNWAVTLGLGPYGNAGTHFMAISGPSALVGAVSQPTSNGTQDISLGFSPGVVLFASDGHAASTAVQNDTQYSIGATDGISQAENWIGDKNAVSTSAAAREHRDDRVITCATVNNPNADVTLNSYASAVFGTTKATLTWGATDSTVRQILYIALQGAVVIAPIALSGIYKLVPDKRQDTVYTAFSPISTIQVAIPEPFGETALIGDDQ